MVRANGSYPLCRQFESVLRHKKVNSMVGQDYGAKLLSATCYFFGVPSLYVILSDLRNKKKIVNHAAQSLLLWGFELLTIVLVRAFMMWIAGSYAVLVFNDYLLGIFWCFMALNIGVGALALLNVKFRLPVITDLAEKVV